MRQQEPIIIYDHLHEEENKALYQTKRSLMINRYLSFIIEELLILTLASLVILAI
jgi:hypothetical protein